MLQCLQMGYAPNEPAVADRHVLAADMERAIALLLKSPTTTIADLVYGMILEFVRTYCRKGNIRLFWTNTANDWSDLIMGSLRDLTASVAEGEAGEQAVYVKLLQIRLIVDALGEERSAGTSEAPSSLHQALLNYVSTGSWRSFVGRIFKLLSPPKSEDEALHENPNAKKERKAKHTGSRPSARSRRVTRSRQANKDGLMDTDEPSMDNGDKHESEDALHSTQSSAADSTTVKMDTGADEDLIESWMHECLSLSDSEYRLRTVLLQLLESLYVLLFPKHENFVDDIVNGFGTLPNDAERLFMLNHFSASIPARLALLDRLLMQNFSELRHHAVTNTPSIPKLMKRYWLLRPLALAEFHSSRRPKSNFTILSTLLLGILDLLDYPNSFKPTEAQECIKMAEDLQGDAQELLGQSSLFLPEEIAQSLAFVQDLVTYVTELA